MEVEGENTVRHRKKLRIGAPFEEVGGKCISSHERSPIEIAYKYNWTVSTAISNTFFLFLFKDLTPALVLKHHNCMYSDTSANEDNSFRDHIR